MKKGVHNLHFFYDGQGKPSIVAWNNGTTTNKYAYVYNLQGDVIALVNSAGTKVVNYTYDAWGKPITKTGSLAGTLGTLNPFRYRGYVYDDEIDFYYLRSRYYNANRGRFINADIIINDNLYTYGVNNPINGKDEDGYVFIMGAYAPSYSYFHDLVKRSVRDLNGMQDEVHPNKQSLLRIDLVKGLEIYEVKPDKVEHKVLGLLQLKLYEEVGKTNGYTIGKTNLRMPNNIIEDRAHETVTISVKQEGPLILYSISRKLKEQKKKNTQKNNNYVSTSSITGAVASMVILSMIMYKGAGGVGGKDACRYCYGY